MNEDKGAAPDAVANKVTYVIGVGSGKGGVGKSTSAVLLAQACAANGLAVAIPCHRVVKSDGALSGYRWGVERKRALLARESDVEAAPLPAEKVA